MNLVDSCGWLEYFADGVNAEAFALAIENADELLVPTIVITEVFKRLLQQRDETVALEAVAHIQTGQVVDFDASLAIEAARLGRRYALPLADSIIYATARRHDATVWTQDAHFEKLAGVRFTPRAN
ncbi:MAG: type II toxin-antitoxin system VapC family toxin [Phycisphaerae bacterium]|nr:type II toxin-antitoxin system VapC family toxin [Phycisphaerae bacterium]